MVFADIQAWRKKYRGSDIPERSLQGRGTLARRIWTADQCKNLRILQIHYHTLIIRDYE